MSMNFCLERWRKLSSKEYREAYSETQMSVDILFQVEALARSHNKTLSDLVKEADAPLAQLEGEEPISPETLHRLAAVFDVGLMVRFVPFSDLVYWESVFDPNTFDVTAFNDDRLPGLDILESAMNETPLGVLRDKWQAA